MVTNSYREERQLKFGTGQLLSDLLNHLGIGNGGRNKVVFIGDKYELGFGSWSESCLNLDWYRDRIPAEEIELPDTTNPNGIQSACIDIADAIRTGRVTNLVLEPNEQVRICKPCDEAPLLRDASVNWRKHKVLAWNNKRVLGLNNYIKQRIISSGRQCAIGDVIVFDNQVDARPAEPTTANQQYVPQFGDPEPRRISTGEFATITGLDKTRHRQIALTEQVPHCDATVSLTLVPATVRLDSSRMGEEFEIYFIKELLESDDARLTDAQETALQIHLKSLMAVAASEAPFEDSPQYAEMIEKNDYWKNERGQYRDKKDRRYLTAYEKSYRAELQKKLLSNDTEYFKWLNASRIRYAWCMTTHKAMAYTFNEVTFSPKTDEGRTNESYLRFLYTGISRARERVNLVRWVPISPFEKTVFGKAGGATASRKRPVILTSTKENVSADINQLVQKALPAGATVVSRKSANYQEIFEIERCKEITKAVFDYTGDAKVKPPRRASGDEKLFADFRNSIERIAPSDETSVVSGIAWLYSFMQEKVLPDFTIRLESSSAFRDVVCLKTASGSITIRIDYKKGGAISSFKLLVGSEETYWIVVDKIRSFYRLGNE